MALFHGHVIRDMFSFRARLYTNDSVCLVSEVLRLWLSGQYFRSISSVNVIDIEFKEETNASPHDNLPKVLEGEHHNATHLIGGDAVQLSAWVLLKRQTCIQLVV